MANSKLPDSIRTQRLQLLPVSEDLAPMVAAFFGRNVAHLAPWNPPAPPGLDTETLQRERLRNAAAEVVAGTASRWWLQPLANPNIVIGNINLTQIVRGAFQNGMLGYAIDSDHEGFGLMREALLAIINHTFSPEFNLHRIQANVRPENVRSIGVIQRLGFEQEGMAREYLFIDGAWRDHLMFTLRNPHFGGIPR